MKTIILTILFTTSLLAQHTISYTFSVEDCVQDGTMTVMNGNMFEGDNMIFEEHTFPQGNSDTQFFYDLLVGGELGFPIGSLKENIHCEIILSGLCNFDYTTLEREEDLLKLLYLVIKVTGENSGAHGETAYYYLENNKESYFRFPLQKLQSFLDYLAYSIDDFTPFYVDSNSNVDYNGIRKETGSEFLSIYSQHFSTIGVGFKVQTPTHVENIEGTPTNYELAQNYPNPFNPSTTISYTLLENGLVKLSVYNSLGQEIQTLVNENQSAGNHSLNFNASNLTSGLYFYTIISGNFTQTNKMVLMK